MKLGKIPSEDHFSGVGGEKEKLEAKIAHLSRALSTRFTPLCLPICQYASQMVIYADKHLPILSPLR